MNAVTRCSVLLITGTFLFASSILAQDKYPVRQLTSAPAQEGFPFWSPDGNTIVYSRVDTADLTGLWMIPADGGKPRQFTKEIGEHPNWSQDGYYIVFDGDSGNSIKLVSSQGGTPVRIIPDSITIFRGGNPKWSPDGTRIAFKEGSNLRVLNLSKGTAPVLFRKDATLPLPCCWSRDGESIFVSLWSIGVRQSALITVTLKGEAKEILPVSEEKKYRYLDQSPDGSLIAYVACVGRACDIWVMPANGGASVKIISHPGYDDTPRWSPDGTRIAFTSSRSGSFDVWVMDLDVEDLRSELGMLGGE